MMLKEFKRSHFDSEEDFVTWRTRALVTLYNYVVAEGNIQSISMDQDKLEELRDMIAILRDAVSIALATDDVTSPLTILDKIWQKLYLSPMENIVAQSLSPLNETFLLECQLILEALFEMCADNNFWIGTSKVIGVPNPSALDKDLNSFVSAVNSWYVEGPIPDIGSTEDYFSPLPSVYTELMYD